jgi:hypothetical protein
VAVEKSNDIIGSAKGSQISEKYGAEVGKRKRADAYLDGLKAGRLMVTPTC